MKEKIKSEWKGALKAIFIVAVLCVGIGIAVAAWDDTKNTGDTLTAVEWNAHVTDQKNAVKKDGSVMMTGSLSFDKDNPSIGVDRIDKNLQLYGGTGYSAFFSMGGQNQPGFGGQFNFYVPNAAKSVHVKAMKIEGVSDTPKLITYFGIKSDLVDENTAAAGVTIDGCLIKDGYPYIPNHTPPNSTDTCEAGQICYDTDYIYMCTALNTWKRLQLATW